MIGITSQPVAVEKSPNSLPALLSMLRRFKHQKASALAQV
jgi:hypothetical protein